MRAGFNLDVDFEHVAMVQLFMGLGVALFFMPVLTILLSDLPAARDRRRLGTGDVPAYPGRSVSRRR